MPGIGAAGSPRDPGEGRGLSFLVRLFSGNALQLDLKGEARGASAPLVGSANSPVRVVVCSVNLAYVCGGQAMLCGRAYAQFGHSAGIPAAAAAAFQPGLQKKGQK